MKVYIAGPMTGYQNFNRDAFDAAADHLRAKGYAVVNPAEMDEAMTVEALSLTPHAVFMRRDIAALLDCDLIYLLPGWKHSKGATLEKAVADGCGIMRLLDHDIETWRTFEGDPEIEEITDHSGCDRAQGDGYGNEWCAHGEQVEYADAPVLHSIQPCSVRPVFVEHPTKGISAADLAAEVRLAAAEGRRA